MRQIHVYTVYLVFVPDLLCILVYSRVYSHTMPILSHKIVCRVRNSLRSMAEIARAMACLVCLTFITLCLNLPPCLCNAYPAYPVFILGLHARVESEDKRRDEVEFKKGIWYIFHKLKVQVENNNFFRETRSMLKVSSLFFIGSGIRPQYRFR